MATRQREKSELREKSRDRRPRAEAKNIRISPSKVEIVLDLVRGKSFAQAAAILSATGKSGCEPVLKVLNSAAANAENNQNMPKDNLFVAECYATSGPTLKRMSARARGRADRILKKTCHITIILDEVKRENSMKKETKKVAKTSPQKKTAGKSTALPKEIPDTQSERPLTNQPNAKKPLGTKKVAAVSGAKAGQAAKDAKTAQQKPAKKETK